ncbi:MAG: transporter substrate-binding domain-containing protein [Moraxellaceae bacterium]|nr:transporter substrate-binding domain-containing protein [Moraxellaceae bacterium]
MRSLLLFVALCAQFSVSVRAEDIKLIYNKNEAKHFVHMLQEALEHTKEMGAYELAETPSPMAAPRAISAIVDNTGELHVITRGSNIEDEKKLLPIRIPLDRGLLGWRLMLVRKQDLPKFAAVNSLEDLQRLKVGQGSQWPDTKILREAGFKVVGGNYSPGLMRMLNEERFDMFARAPWEAAPSLKTAEDMPDLVLEPSLVLVYPLPRYFMVSQTGNGPALAKRIETGLRRMMASGKYEELFEKYFGSFVESTQLKSRKVIRMDNATLPPETPLNDASLWFDPTGTPPPAKAPVKTAAKS